MSIPRLRAPRLGIAIFDSDSEEGCHLAGHDSEQEWVPAGVWSQDASGAGRARVATEYRRAFVSTRDDCVSFVQAFEEMALKQYRDELQDRWSIPVDYAHGGQLVRYRPGDYFVPHKDANSRYPERLVTAIMYLNSDFSGGSTFFPDLNWVCRPRQGRTLYFLSEFLHGSDKIVSGVKLIAVTFLCRKMAKWI